MRKIGCSGLSRCVKWGIPIEVEENGQWVRRMFILDTTSSGPPRGIQEAKETVFVRTKDGQLNGITRHEAYARFERMLLGVDSASNDYFGTMAFGDFKIMSGGIQSSHDFVANTANVVPNVRNTLFTTTQIRGLSIGDARDPNDVARIDNILMENGITEESAINEAMFFLGLRTARTSSRTNPVPSLEMREDDPLQWKEILEKYTTGIEFIRGIGRHEGIQNIHRNNPGEFLHKDWKNKVNNKQPFDFRLNHPEIDQLLTKLEAKYDTNFSPKSKTTDPASIAYQKDLQEAMKDTNNAIGNYLFKYYEKIIDDIWGTGSVPLSQRSDEEAPFSIVDDDELEYVYMPLIHLPATGSILDRINQDLLTLRDIDEFVDQASIDPMPYIISEVIGSSFQTKRDLVIGQLEKDRFITQVMIDVDGNGTLDSTDVYSTNLSSSYSYNGVSVNLDYYLDTNFEYLWVKNTASNDYEHKKILIDGYLNPDLFIMDTTPSQTLVDGGMIPMPNFGDDNDPLSFIRLLIEFAAVNLAQNHFDILTAIYGDDVFGLLISQLNPSGVAAIIEQYADIQLKKITNSLGVEIIENAGQTEIPISPYDFHQGFYAALTKDGFTVKNYQFNSLATKYLSRTIIHDKTIERVRQANNRDSIFFLVSRSMTGYYSRMVPSEFATDENYNLWDFINTDYSSMLNFIDGGPFESIFGHTPVPNMLSFYDSGTSFGYMNTMELAYMYRSYVYEFEFAYNRLELASTQGVLSFTNSFGANWNNFKLKFSQRSHPEDIPIHIRLFIRMIEDSDNLLYSADGRMLVELAIERMN